MASHCSWAIEQRNLESARQQEEVWPASTHHGGHFAGQRELQEANHRLREAEYNQQEAEEEPSCNQGCKKMPI